MRRDGNHGRKAKLFLQVSCPACDQVMYNYADYMCCQNESCELAQIKWERPTIQLRKYEINHETG